MFEFIIEFGIINVDYVVSSYCYIYVVIGKLSWFLFDGLVKYDLFIGNYECYLFGDGVYGSEIVMVLWVGSSVEDDGYLVIFIIDMNDDVLYCLVFDVVCFGDGLICKFVLLECIFSGMYLVWVLGVELCCWDYVELLVVVVGL